MLGSAGRRQSRDRDQRTRYEDLGGSAHRGGDHTEVSADYDRPVRHRLACAAALLAAGWCVYGCGNTTLVAPDRSVDVALTEYSVRPQSIRASSGQLTIVVHNYGRLTHNLVVS